MSQTARRSAWGWIPWPQTRSIAAVFNHPQITMTTRHQPRWIWKALALSCALACALPQAAVAQRNNVSADLSALSFLPVMVSVAVPMTVLSVGAFYTVKAVELSADGTVWVLERASDGTRISLALAGGAAAGVSLAAGTTVTALACSAGWVLHVAGKAVAIVPNALGQTLIYNERVTR